MKIFLVMTLARQIHGEYCFLRPEGAFTLPEKAGALLDKLKSDFKAADGQPKPLKISTPHGEAVCLLEAGGFEVEVE